MGKEFVTFYLNDESSDDYKIYRTSSGNRYDGRLSPALNNVTADVPGGDGTFYFNTHKKNFNIDIDFAFDNLTKEDISNLRAWFLQGSEKNEPMQLVFEEDESRFYYVVCNNAPSLKYIPFSTPNGTIYKGEGKVQFVSYLPYALGEKVEAKQVSTELPVPFELTHTATEDDEINVSSTSFTLKKDETLTWNSKTGIAKIDGRLVTPDSGPAIVLLENGTVVNYSITYTPRYRG